MIRTPEQIARDVYFAKPRHRGMVLQNAFPLAEVAVFWDESKHHVEAVAYDKRRVVPLSYGCRYELILRALYDDTDILDQSRLFELILYVVKELHKYFDRGECDD
jgi:hypothetical protein